MNKKLNFALFLGGNFALLGCTAVRVTPVTADNRIEHICILDNPRVQVGDFVEVMQEGFQKHGISSQVISGQMPAACVYSSTYTALRTWDLAMYMTDAQIDILHDGRQIASANYHLKGRGGLSLNKWDNTRTKNLPVIDQLLAQVQRPAPGARTFIETKPAVEAAPTAAKSKDLATKLSQLKDAYDAGLITQDEYEKKRKALLDNL